MLSVNIFVLTITLIFLPFWVQLSYAEELFFSDCHYSRFAEEVINNEYKFVPANVVEELKEFYYRGGRLVGVVFTIPDHLVDLSNFDSRLLKMYHLYSVMVRENNDFLVPLNSKNKFNDQKLNTFISIEGITPSALSKILSSDSLKNIKIVGLIHNSDNQFGSSSSTPDTTDAGLTLLGKSTVLRLIKQRIIIDISHFSKKSFWDAVELCDKYKGRIIASHTGIIFFRTHPRNLCDEQLSAIRKLNGGIGIISHKPLISNEKEKVINTNRILNIQYHLISKSKMPYVFLGSDLCGEIQLIDDVTQLSDMPIRIESSPLNQSEQHLKKRLIIDDLMNFLEITK